GDQRPDDPLEGLATDAEKGHGQAERDNAGRRRVGAPASEERAPEQRGGQGGDLGGVEAEEPTGPVLGGEAIGTARGHAFLLDNESGGRLALPGRERSERADRVVVSGRWPFGTIGPGADEPAAMPVSDGVGRACGRVPAAMRWRPCT